MPFNAIVYKVFIASPSDVEKEREAVSLAIHEWNMKNASEKESVMLLPVKYENNTLNEMNRSIQEVIKDVLKTCDIAICIFWTRLGTKSQNEESGTLGEIEEFIRNEKIVLCFFKDEKPDFEIDELEKYEELIRVRKFKKTLEGGTYYVNFTDINRLKEEVKSKLDLWTRRIKPTKTPPPIITEPIKKYFNPYDELINKLEASQIKPLELEKSNRDEILLKIKEVLDFLDKYLNSSKETSKKLKESFKTGFEISLFYNILRVKIPSLKPEKLGLGQPKDFLRSIFFKTAFFIHQDNENGNIRVGIKEKEGSIKKIQGFTPLDNEEIGDLHSIESYKKILGNSFNFLFSMNENEATNFFKFIQLYSLSNRTKDSIINDIESAGFTDDKSKKIFAILTKTEILKRIPVTRPSDENIFFLTTNQQSEVFEALKAKIMSVVEEKIGEESKIEIIAELLNPILTT